MGGMMAYLAFFTAVSLFVNIMARVLLYTGFGIVPQLGDAWWWGITGLSTVIGILVCSIVEDS